MSGIGASTRGARIACGLGCAVVLIAGVLAMLPRRADAEESATAEIWSKAMSEPSAVASIAPSSAASPTPAASASPIADTAAPATGYSLPMTITAPETGELRVKASEPSAPSNLTANVPDENTGTLPTTEEIPAVASRPAPTEQASPTPQDVPAATVQDHDLDSPDVARYERDQLGIIDPKQYHDLRSLMDEGAFTSPIGLELREARRRLSDGEEADGLLVVDVAKGSPAYNAGLHAYKNTAHNVVTGAALVAAMVFPPAIFAVPLIDYAQVGESYDMIIGVDGARVTNYLDFEDRLHDLRPGEIVYLSVVRDGKRQQIKVFLPPTSTLTW